MNSLKVILAYILFTLLAISLIVIAVFAARSLSTAITRVELSQVTDTIACAYIVTSDGAAISCFPAELEKND